MCKNNGGCLDECPMDAIKTGEDDRNTIDPDICTDCGSCADICPAGAIAGVVE